MKERVVIWLEPSEIKEVDKHVQTMTEIIKKEEKKKKTPPSRRKRRVSRSAACRDLILKALGKGE